MLDAVEAPSVQVVESPYPQPLLAWYSTILLAVMYWLSVLDRFIISLLVGPIKRDLGITDLQFGMLHGLAFAATFALFGVALGALADRANRRLVIFIGVSVWSLATAACGFAQSFVHLLLARVGVGAGEATLNPSATSLLTDMFPRERLTLAMAVYAMGSTIGAGTAYLVGGAIVELVAQSEVFHLPIVGDVRSWQAVFFIVGVPGALFSFAIFTLPEPVRRGLRLGDRQNSSLFSSYAALWTFMKSRPRFFACHYIGFGLSTAVVTGGGGWYAVHVARAFGWAPGQIGLYLGLTTVGAAIIGKSTSGRIMDVMFSRGYRDAQMRWYLGCLIVAVPVALYAFTSTSPTHFFVGMGLFLLLLQSFPVCAFTSLNLVTPNHLRGTGVALFSATAGLIGGAAGPIFIPFAASRIYHNDAAIGLGMATLAGVCCPLAAIALALGLKAMREAVPS